MSTDGGLRGPSVNGRVHAPARIGNRRGSAVIDGLNQMLAGAEVVEAEAEDGAPGCGGGGDGCDATVREAVDDPHRLARLFVAQSFTHPERPTLVRHRDEFLAWDGARYREAPDVKHLLVASIRAEFERANRVAVAGLRSSGGGGEPPTVRKVNTRLVGDATQALASLTHVSAGQPLPSWLGQAVFPVGEVLACRNALIHLPAWVAGRGGRIDPSPRFFSTTALPVDFDPVAPVPARWYEFLREIWPEDPQAIATLQEWFGYSLTPDTTRQKILLVVGPSRSGKGTIGRVLRGLLGPDGVTNPTLAGLATNFGLAPLIGKALAVISDARLSGRTDQGVIVERLLSISGEDSLTIDRKNRAPWTGRLSTRLMLLTNELPRLRDASAALANRFIVLRQTETFLGRENALLTDQLLGELPGILMWAVGGWARLRDRDRFDPPDSGAVLADELVALSSPVSQFVAECCLVGSGQNVSVDGLYSRWQGWCEVQGRDHPGDKAAFGRDLRAVVPGVDNQPRHRDGGQVRTYLGIGLRPRGGG